MGEQPPGVAGRKARGKHCKTGRGKTAPAKKKASTPAE